MKKNIKKGLGLLSLLLMAGLVIAVAAPGVSADEPEDVTPPAVTQQEPGADEDFICPMTGEPRPDDRPLGEGYGNRYRGAGPNAGGEGTGEGTGQRQRLRDGSCGMVTAPDA